ncbi:uncharacterized protein G2W53_008249 [Senna tora]|uniref:Uncharacterized protein n=1 Tax=Senna tora TaxID=362788 RepID=A0A834X8A2_9FABA|nr:uncharacterized protein G2W53_008249 [Senna tora]
MQKTSNDKNANSRSTNNIRVKKEGSKSVPAKKSNQPKDAS